MARTRTRRGKRSARSMAQPKKRPDEAGQQENEGDTGGKKFHAVDPENQNREAKIRPEDPRPGRLDREVVLSTFLLSQMRKAAKKGTRKSVRVIGHGVPVVDQLDGDPVVKDGQQTANDGVGKPVDPRRTWICGIGKCEVRFLGNEIRGVGHGVRVPVSVRMTLYFT